MSHGSRGLAAIVARLRRRKDAWTHASRHLRAKAVVRGIGRPRSILVVCQGNVCRSPFMAALLQQWLPDISVSSAGFVVPGRQVPEYGRSAAAKRGLDLSTHQSRLVTRELIAAAGLIIVMDSHQARHIARASPAAADRVIVAGDLDPLNRDGRTVRDPWQQPLEVFESAYARLERCAAVLANEVATHVAPAQQWHRAGASNG